MSSNSEALAEVVNRLGFFTGDIGEHQFVARLLNQASTGGSSPDPGSSADAIEAMSSGISLSANPQLAALIGSLCSMTDGGVFFQKFIDDGQAFLAGAEADNIDAKIRGTSGTPRLFTVTSKDTFQTDKEFCSSCEIGSIIDASGFNENFSAPTKEKPNIGVLQFHDVALNFANRSSGMVGVFLNMLPTLEMSKCQPYVDIKLITATAQSKPIKDASGNITGAKIGNGISLLRFLKGTDADMGIDNPMLLGLPIGLDIAQEPVLNDHGEQEYDENGQPKMMNKPTTVAGMEIFTAPQTLVNGNEPHYDIGPYRTEIVNVGGVNEVQVTTPSSGTPIPPGRTASVIDKFRPFLTLKSFDVDVQPARGMISTKSASIKFTLHDRSRLAEIGQLVKPDGLSKVEIMAEYGWSHPEGTGSKNLFATMLNSFRVKEKFMVVNSSMSFDDVGQVEVSLKLVSKGNQDMSFRMVTNKECAESMDEIKNIFNRIRELKKEIRGDLQDNEEMIGSETLGKANSVSAIMNMTAEDMAALQTLLTNLEANNAENTPYDDLAESMTQALTAVSSFESQLQAAMQGKIAALDALKDPFIKGCSAAGIALKDVGGDIRGKDHVSFAKVALEFIAKPLAATHRFDEVQLCFYPMNQYCTFAKDDDTGSFPFNREVFQKTLMEKLKKNPAMTVAAFMGFINTTFFNEMASDIYGFGSIYERDPETGKKKLRAEFEESEEARTQIASEKNKVYEDAYGPDGEKKFIKPSVQMYMEAVPGADAASGGDNATILRIHFFDKAATSFSGFADLWESLRGSMSSAINSAAVSALKIKDDPIASDDEGYEEQQATLSGHSEQFQQQLALLQELDILELIGADGAPIPGGLENLEAAVDVATGLETDPDQISAIQATLAGSFLRIKGGPMGMKYLFHRNMPSIKYGSTYSAVISAKLATQADARMATIHMQRAKSSGGGPEGAGSDGLPLRTFPGSLSMTTWGCPLFNFGQQFFVDFGTGTTLDDVYGVTGVSHKFAPGTFETQLKFVPLQKFGTYQSLMGNMGKLIAEVSSLAPTPTT